MLRLKRMLDLVVRTLVILVGAVTLILVCVRLLLLSSPEPASNIAHAGGAIGGQIYTNALAAMDASHARGFRSFEIDFIETADGHWVCGHDWDALDGVAPDLAGFLEWRDTLPFPPCTVEKLVEWFDARPGTELVTDAKTDDPILVNGHLHGMLGGRMIAQAYSADQVCRLSEIGVERIYLTFYTLPPTLSRLREELHHPCVEAAGLEGVVVPFERAMVGHALVARFVSRRPVIVHTVNGCSPYWVARIAGADAVMSDVLEPGRCWP
jgi:hypothetical protein